MNSIGTVLFSTRVSQLKFLSCFQMCMRVFMRTCDVYTALRASARLQPRVGVCVGGGSGVHSFAKRTEIVKAQSSAI